MGGAAIAWLLLLPSATLCSRLNVPRVLLPHSEARPAFPLQAESGCYSWVSTRPDAVQVTAPGPGCSDSAEIQAVADSGGKVAAMIMAEDARTGLLLRADVILDNIASLRIVTKTHELLLEETPEKFETRAYDDQGNEFSTLKGVAFQWLVEGIGIAKGNDILRLMTWADSPYKTQPWLEALEARGGQGNRVLLEGTKTGSARVSVKLAGAVHSTVRPASESLVVVANLLLVPAAARLLPCATLPYTAQRMRAGRLLQLPLPSEQHELVAGPGLGSIAGAVLTAAGETGQAGQVRLRDRNVDPGEEVKTPSAEVWVVEPGRLQLVCLPHHSCTVMAGTEVTLAVTILDTDNNKVTLSDNLVVELVADPALLPVSRKLDNGTQYVVSPPSPGQVEVTVRLVGAGTCLLQQPLELITTLEVVARLEIQPETTQLPWDPVSGTSYEVEHSLVGAELSATSWTSSHPDLARVDRGRGGGVVVSGAVLGTGVVAAHLTRHPHCRAEAVITTLPAIELVLGEGEQEFPLGSSLEIPVLLHHETGQFQSDCHVLPLHPSLSHPAFTAGVGPGSCATLTVQSGAAGEGEVGLDWSYPGLDGEEVVLTARRLVAAFPPLHPSSPHTGSTRVGWGTGRLVSWEGGPAPWPLSPSSHRVQLTATPPDVLTTKQGETEYEWWVECKAEGSVELVLSVGNLPSATLPRPVTSTSTVSVECAKAHSIELAAQVAGPTLPGLPPCPLAAQQGRLPAQAYLPLTLLVTILDREGQQLDSVTGLQVDWTLSSPDLATVTAPASLLLAEDGSYYQQLQPAGQEGELDVTATIARDGGLLGAATHSATAELRLVQDASLSLTSLDLFQLETSSAVASHGSGYFTVVSDPPALLSTAYNSGQGEVVVEPVGGTGAGEVSLLDLCLSTRQPANILVRVAGVAAVELRLPDRVQLGTSLTAAPVLLDSEGRELRAGVLQLVRLQLEAGGHQPDSLQQEGGVTEQGQFPLTAVSLGTASFTALVNYGELEVRSNPATVTVYPPLRIEPRNIRDKASSSDGNLIIGASFQFFAEGGPGDCAVQWRVEEDRVAQTNTEGVVTSLALGETRVTATAIGGDGTVFGTDTALVSVRLLTSVELRSPVTTVEPGCLLPLYLWGQDDAMSPYSYGSAVPALTVEWSLTGGAELVSPLQPAGFTLLPANAGVAVLRAGAGSARATVTVVVRGGEQQLEGGSHTSLTATREIRVEPGLEVTNPPQSGLTRLLLPPGASYQLQTNRPAVWSGGAQGGAAAVTEGGLVKAGEKTETVILTATSATGDLVTAVLLEVRPVEYTLVRGAGAGWTALPDLTTLPVGGALDLLLTQHDSRGRMFDIEAGAGAGVRPSRLDHLSGTGTGKYRAASTGWTVLQHDDAWLAPLPTDQALAGPTSIIVGDVAVYTSLAGKLGNGEGEVVWAVEPAGGVQLVQHSSGVVVVAARSGVVRLTCSLTSSINLTKVVTIRQGGPGLVLPDQLLGGGAKQEVQLVLGGGQGHTNLQTTLPLPDLPIPPPHTCQATWDLPDLDLSSVWRLEPDWGGRGWICRFQRIGVAPAQPAVVTVQAGGGAGEVRYLPPLTTPHTSLQVGAGGGEILLAGHPVVLDQLVTRPGEGVEVGAGYSTGELGQLVLPVSLTQTHYTAPPRVRLEVPGQQITVTILPLVSSPATARSGILSALTANLLTHYQSVLCILLAAGLAVLVTRAHLRSAPAPVLPAPTLPTPASPDKQGDKAGEAGSPYLWTVDNNPIYGSPIYRRSPQSQPRNLAQFSYN